MMRLSPPVQALLSLWPELPQRLGADWPSVYWRALDLLRRYATLEDEEQRAAVALQIARLLRSLPGGSEALRRFAPSRRTRGTEGDTTLFDDRLRSAEAEARLQAILHPPTVTRYTDIYAPPRVAVGKRFPIIVGLTRAPGEGEAAAIQTQLNQLIRVVLTPRGPEVLGERTKTLRVAEAEGEPVVFYLRTTRIGTQSVLIDFYSESHLLASVTHTLTAEEADVIASPGKLPAQALRIGDYRTPFPDLVLRVCTRDNRLTYTLHYHDTLERVIEGGKLRADPEQYRYNIIREIENLALGKDVDGHPLTDNPDLNVTPEVFFRHLEKVGQRLYRDLFNEEMRREYRERIRGKVKTLQIVSDEPWIPWELIKPYGDGVDDDFLCMQFDFSRWVSGGWAPAAEIVVESLACIAPTDSGLTWAQEERSFLHSLADELHLTDHSPAEAGREQVVALLEGDEKVGLWHFASHGNYDPDAPNNSPLILQNNRRLRPNDVVGRAEERLKQDRPLVFLNACRVGQGGLSLTGLGGWAKVLVQDCRVGALIAPLWSVSDEAAAYFARAFYEAAQEPGMTLAAAVRQARIKTREAYPTDPTYLAYSLYAHPNARLLLGTPPWAAASGSR